MHWMAWILVQVVGPHLSQHSNRHLFNLNSFLNKTTLINSNNSNSNINTILETLSLLVVLRTNTSIIVRITLLIFKLMKTIITMILKSQSQTGNNNRQWNTIRHSNHCLSKKQPPREKPTKKLLGTTISSSNCQSKTLLQRSPATTSRCHCQPFQDRRRYRAWPINTELTNCNNSNLNSSLTMGATTTQIIRGWRGLPHRIVCCNKITACLSPTTNRFTLTK